MSPTGRARKSRAARSGPRALCRGGEFRVRFRLNASAIRHPRRPRGRGAQRPARRPRSEGLARGHRQETPPGDRMPRHGVKTHTRRVVALDHRRLNLAVRVRRHIYMQQILLAALVEPYANWRAARGGPADGQPHRQTCCPRERQDSAAPAPEEAVDPRPSHSLRMLDRHRVANDAAEVPGGRSRWPLSWVPNNSTPQAGHARPVHLPVMPPQTTACESAHRLCECTTRGRCARIRCKGHRCTRLSGVTARWAPGARRESAWQRRRR
jgi:hypothetical protein